MDTIEKAKQELVKRQEALSRLTDENSKIAESIQKLQTERSAAVRALAAGDDSKRKIILNIESKIAPLSLRAEGLRELIAEVNTEINKAQDALTQAQDAEAQKFNAWMEEQERQALDTLRAGVSKREDRIYALYERLCLELGEAEVDKWQLEKKSLRNPIDAMLEGLSIRFSKRIKTKSRIQYARAPGLEIWPYLDGFPGRPVINASEVSAEMQEIRRTELMERYKKANS